MTQPLSPLELFHPEDLRDKSAALISHVQSEGTTVFETPLEELRKHPITPLELLFMRNSYAIPKMAELMDTTLGVVGLVEFPLMLEISKIRSLDTLELVMQCAGNGRKFFRDAKHIEGSDWGRGGVANLTFSGTWLRDLLPRDIILPEAQFLTMRGHDHAGDLEQTPYEKSIPLEAALESAFLATHLNGEKLTRVHGAPLRLVMPGYFATVNVKWLSTLILTAQESQNEAQQVRYRVPAISETGETGSRACWAMPIKSMIWSPLEGENCTPDLAISGVAWNDGKSPIQTVEISVDLGESWQQTMLEQSSQPYGWVHWHLNLALPSSVHQVWSRATDEMGRTQPLEGDVHWNPDGYEWNGVDKVSFTVSLPHGHIEGAKNE